jgi:alkanesulfonate monooxygenase SsuD/methylene tetrahydromethanopterin reductase-like flavin-dependent oxidoreductase (luciferase family)
LRLGVGVGWNPFEYEALGENFRNRGRRIEEQIALLRRLWADELVDFNGTWHTVLQSGISPLPPRRSIPVWMGGMSEAALRRAGRIADGWIQSTFQPGPQAAETIERLRGFVREAGRASDVFGIEARINVFNTPADRWADALDSWRGLGVTHVSLNTMSAQLDSPREHIDAIARFMDVARAYQ